MTVLDSFARALGPGRGIKTHSDAGRERVLHALAVCGVADAVRAMGTDREQLLANDEFVKRFADSFFRSVFASERGGLRAFTKAVGLRPHWSFHFGADGTVVHFYPTGHRFADSSDLMGLAAPGDEAITLDVEVRASCGIASEAMHPLNRGALADMRRRSSLWEFCEQCMAEHADHPEAGPDDDLLPLPADRLETGLADWRARSWPQAREALLHGSAETACQEAAWRLDEMVLGWAAGMYERHTRANALRALRSNGSGMLTITAAEAHLLIPGLLERALTRDDWLELLRDARNCHRAGGKDLNARWAQAVQLVSDGRDSFARGTLAA